MRMNNDENSQGADTTSATTSSGYKNWRSRETLMTVAEREVNEWIYFIRCGSLVKIGYTTNLRQRLVDLRSDMEWSGASLELLLKFPGDKTMEKELHRHYKKYRVSLRSWREWFHLKGELKDFLLANDCQFSIQSDRIERIKMPGFIEKPVSRIEPSATHFWCPSMPPSAVLRLLMEKSCSTQEQISKVMGCNRSNVSHVMRGAQQLTAEQIDRLARHFDVPHSMFFGS